MIRAEPSTAIGEQTSPEAAAETDPRQRLELLFRDLRSSADGLTDREAARRLIVYGRNELTRQGKRRWPAELVAQFLHPLALLLAAAAILAVISGSPVLGAAIAAVIAVLILAGFFIVLRQGGWHPHADTGPGSPLDHVYQQATTVAWLGIVACQVGTTFAARTERASLRSVGQTTNPLLLGAIAIELAFAAALIYVPFLHPHIRQCRTVSRADLPRPPLPYHRLGCRRGTPLGPTAPTRSCPHRKCRSTTPPRVSRAWCRSSVIPRGPATC
jgi:magnesium-transporting ATPase (P-type)